MKKRFLLIFPVLAVFFLIMNVSCESAPESDPGTVTTPPTTSPVTPSTPTPGAPLSIEALTEAIANADNARRRAMDFESSSYFPSDWDRIEAQYNTAKNMPRSTQNDIQQAVISVNSAAASYDALFMRTAPLYAQAREDEIMAARDELIATGLTPFIPEYLRSADMQAIEALDKYEAGDYYGARDTAAGALARYEDLLFAAKVYIAREDLINTGLVYLAPEYLDNVDDIALDAIDLYDAGDYPNARINAERALADYEDLLFGARVYLLRQEIIDRGFVHYDLNNFNRADDVACAAIDDYDAGNSEAAREKAEEAMLRYNIVLSNGWTAYSLERQAAAINERNLALAERVNIASRESFREADAVFSQAEAELRAGNHSEAAIRYINAEVLFAIARYETEERRVWALEMIRLAEERIEQSDETAAEAERIIEGGSR